VSLHGVLGLLQQQLDLLLCSLGDTTGYSHYPFCGVFLDHLDDADIIPHPKMWPSPLASENRSPKNVLYCRYIRHKAIYAKQQGTTKSTTAYLLYQAGYQIPISTGTYCTTKPEASGNPKGHSHPDYAALALYPYLICLNLTQVTGLLHQVFMNLLAVRTSTALPGCHRAFIHSIGSHYSCYGTAISQKRYHLSYELHRISKAIEHCAFAIRECLSTLTADVTPLLEAMDTDVAMTRFSSCRTVWIVAEYFTGIHLLTPFSYFCVLKGCQWIPFFVNPFLHTLMWGYLTILTANKSMLDNN
jgi:hypothetical protein